MLYQTTRCRGLCLAATFLIAVLLLVSNAHAETVVEGDVTEALGPDFFVDKAAIGGDDQVIKQGNIGVVRCDFAAIRPLNVGKAGSKVTITGLGWASPKSLSNTPTSVQVTIVYLGADGKGGGGDDVTIGSATAQYSNVKSGEYFLKFDKPMSAVVDGKSSFFRVDFSPINEAGNALLLLKKEKDETKLTVAGVSQAVE